MLKRQFVFHNTLATHVAGEGDMKIGVLVVALLTVAVVSVSAYGQAGEKSTATVTGCLHQEKDGDFDLYTSSGEIELSGSGALKNHVGHEIKVTGKWVKEKEEHEKAEHEEGSERHMQVSKIEMVSTTCKKK